MTPGARLQTAIELLDEIIAAARANGAAADTIIARGFAARRYAGSKDRAAVRALVYRAIRAFGEIPENARAAFVTLAARDAVLADAFDGTPYGPRPLGKGEARAVPSLLPRWLGGLIDPEEHAALLDRAPLDLRVNRTLATPEALIEVWPEAVRVEGVPDALRFAEAFAVEQTPEWNQGFVEIQDAGSQLVVQAAGVQPGMTVVDLCAGGGGKTLALAAAMRGEGKLIASDTDRTRLQRLPPRAARTGVSVETRLLDPQEERAELRDVKGQADVVLIDAPCSGSGTLRRNPEARWRLSQARLDRLVALQAHILDLGAELVKPGGALTYAVCSLIDAEGAGQVAQFLTRYPGWRSEPPFAAGRARGPGRMLTPAHDATDGFFVARLICPC